MYALLYIITGRLSNAERLTPNPYSQRSGTLFYQLPGYQGDDTAIFTFRNGKVVTVEWHWFVE